MRSILPLSCRVSWCIRDIWSKKKKKGGGEKKKRNERGTRPLTCSCKWESWISVLPTYRKTSSSRWPPDPPHPLSTSESNLSTCRSTIGRPTCQLPCRKTWKLTIMIHRLFLSDPNLTRQTSRLPREVVGESKPIPRTSLEDEKGEEGYEDGRRGNYVARFRFKMSGTH